MNGQGHPWRKKLHKNGALEKTSQVIPFIKIFLLKFSFHYWIQMPRANQHRSNCIWLIQIWVGPLYKGQNSWIELNFYIFPNVIFLWGGLVLEGLVRGYKSMYSRLCCHVQQAMLPCTAGYVCARCGKSIRTYELGLQKIFRNMWSHRKRLQNITLRT